MENMESILEELEKFEQKVTEVIPVKLEDYICVVAKTGDPIFPWNKIRLLLRQKLTSVMNDFYEQWGDEVVQGRNVPVFSFPATKEKILQHFDIFTGAPFTLQRLCEIMVDPTRHYKQIDKLLCGIEKNLFVVSVVDSHRTRRESTEQMSMVNGMADGSSHSSPEWTVSPSSSPVLGAQKSGKRNATALTEDEDDEWQGKVTEDKLELNGEKESPEPNRKRIKSESPPLPLLQAVPEEVEHGTSTTVCHHEGKGVEIKEKVEGESKEEMNGTTIEDNEGEIISEGVSSENIEEVIESERENVEAIIISKENGFHKDEVTEKSKIENNLHKPELKADELEIQQEEEVDDQIQEPQHHLVIPEKNLQIHGKTEVKTEEPILEMEKPEDSEEKNAPVTEDCEIDSCKREDSDFSDIKVEESVTELTGITTENIDSADKSKTENFKVETVIVENNQERENPLEDSTAKSAVTPTVSGNCPAETLDVLPPNEKEDCQDQEGVIVNFPIDKKQTFTEGMSAVEKEVVAEDSPTMFIEEGSESVETEGMDVQEIDEPMDVDS